MRIPAIFDPDNRLRQLAMARKSLGRLLRGDCESFPIFVLGMQRSGTTMLMRVFHRHKDTLVFDEHSDSEAFHDHCLRPADKIRNILEESRFPFVCFKPICDSHKIQSLMRDHPDGHFVWIYRDYADVANSYVRKFANPSRAIRLVCTGQSGGGWFQDGVSPQMLRVLDDVFRPEMSDLELACLIWWARNQALLESGLVEADNLTLVKYESLVSHPIPVLQWLFDRIRLPYSQGVTARISPRSIRRHPSPSLDARVKNLCSTSLRSLDDAYESRNPPKVI